MSSMDNQSKSISQPPKTQQFPTSDSLLDSSLATSAESQQLNSSTMQNNTTNNINNQSNRTMQTLGGQNMMNSGGYGASSLMNSSYGNSYGSSSYGMGGMSSLGGMSNMSMGGMYGNSMMGGYNNMNMMNNNNQQQPQQPGFRDEYQGVLIGFNSMLNIMGAGIGMIGYGTTFFHYTKKAISFIFSCFSNFTYKILGIAYLKKLVRWMTNSNIEKDFSASFQAAALGQKSGVTQKLFGKLLVVVRVLSGLALLGFYFMQYRLRKRMQEIQKEQQNLMNFDNNLENLIFDRQSQKSDKKEQDFITINMNSDKAEIIDDLDAGLNEEEEEEEEEHKEGVLNESQEQEQKEDEEEHKEIAKDIKEELGLDIIDNTEINEKVEDLQDVFDNVINKEKTFVQQTQVRSEEFWKHTQPSDFTSTTNTQSEVIPTVAIQEVETTTPTAPASIQTNTEQNNNTTQDNLIENEQTNNFIYTPISNSYPETYINFAQPIQSNEDTNIFPSIPNAASSDNIEQQSSVSILGEPIQQPKIFKQVSNRLKPWQK